MKNPKQVLYGPNGQVVWESLQRGRRRPKRSKLPQSDEPHKLSNAKRLLAVTRSVVFVLGLLSAAGGTGYYYALASLDIKEAWRGISGQPALVRQLVRKTVDLRDLVERLTLEVGNHTREERLLQGTLEVLQAKVDQAKEQNQRISVLESQLHDANQKITALQETNQALLIDVKKTLQRSDDMTGLVVNLMTGLHATENGIQGEIAAKKKQAGNPLRNGVGFVKSFAVASGFVQSKEEGLQEIVDGLKKLLTKAEELQLPDQRHIASSDR